MKQKNYCTIGNILGESFELYFKNLLPLILSAFVFSIPYGLAMHFYIQYFLSLAQSPGNLEEYAFYSKTALSLGFMLLAGLILLVYYIFAIKLISNCYLDKKESLSDLLKMALKRFFPFLGMQLLIGLLMIPAVIALIIPAYILTFACSLTPYIFTIEGRGPWASIKRSWKLTKGSKGKIFVVNLILTICIFVMYFVIMLLGMLIRIPLFTPEASIDGMNNAFTLQFILWSLISAVTMPLFLATGNSIYYNILKDKEGFATEQLTDSFMEEEGPLHEG